jgi:hypothetical protein
LAQGYTNISIYELQDTSPGSPVPQILIMPIGGYPPDGHFGAVPNDQPSVSVIVYDDDLADAETLAEGIRQIFLAEPGLSGCLRIRTTSSHVSYLGRDESRTRFKLSFVLEAYLV